VCSPLFKSQVYTTSISQDENVAAAIIAIHNLRNFVCRLLSVLSGASSSMTIEVHFSDRFYGVFERIAHAVESIDNTLKTTPDFTDEDKAVKKAAQDLAEAKERIPHGAETTN
jgi:hypothetical protein